jgi:hypothetical protein
MSYLRELAEAIRDEVPAKLIPPGSDDLFLIYAVLARAKRQRTTVGDVHDAWSAWMEMRGEQHDSMVPFAQLNESVRTEDIPFVQAIHAVVTQAVSSSSDD